MKAVVWHGRQDVRTETVPDPTIRAADGCDRAHHEHRAVRIRPAPVHRAGAVHDCRRRARSRADGDRRSGRFGRQQPVGRRPGRGAVQHLVRALLHVRARSPVAVRDDPGPRARHRCLPVRLHQALRPSPGRTGRAAACSARRLWPRRGSRRSAGRSLPVHVRRAADGVASRAIRRPRQGGVAGGAGAGADRRHVVPGRATPRRRTRDRHRSRARAARAGAGARDRRARSERLRQRRRRGRRRTRA